MSRTEKIIFRPLCGAEKEADARAEFHRRDRCAHASFREYGQDVALRSASPRRADAEYHSPSLQPEYKRPLPKIGGAIQ